MTICYIKKFETFHKVDSSNIFLFFHVKIYYSINLMRQNLVSPHQYHDDTNRSYLFNEILELLMISLARSLMAENWQIFCELCNV